MFSSLFAGGASKKKAVEVKRMTIAPARPGSSAKQSAPQTNGVNRSSHGTNGTANGLVSMKKNGSASSKTSTHSKTPNTVSSPAPTKRKSTHPDVRSETKTRKSQLQQNRRSQSVHTPMFGSEDSDSESDDEAAKAAKRRRLEAEEVDKKRILRRIDTIDKDVTSSKPKKFIHASEISVLDKTAKFAPLFEELPEGFELELQYPSKEQREKFHLLQPLHDSHGFQAVSDIVETMHEVAANFLPEDLAEKFDDESTGYPQRLQRAIKKKDPETIQSVIQGWNDALQKSLEDGTIAKVLDGKHTLRPTLVERILNQAYSRTVSPNLKLLKKYQAGTDNVYGELLPKFVTKILKEDLRLRSDQVFVDLGSGVGNVVLQAALEVGCESWGCEMMKDYCRVADLQQTEFEARSALWGLQIGRVTLEKGDFTENAAIKKILKKADAVLVNNQVFTPATNEALTTLFLDLKDGCRVVSLKSFVPADHKITARNLYSPYNLLSVEKKRYFSNCVSWTNEGGTYFISTKDSKRVENFLKKRQVSGESDNSR